MYMQTVLFYNLLTVLTLQNDFNFLSSTVQMQAIYGSNIL
jgi:hypothetical protein